GRLVQESYNGLAQTVRATDQYDVMGRLARATVSGAIGVPGHDEVFKYDALGNLTARLDLAFPGGSYDYRYALDDPARLRRFSPATATNPGCTDAGQNLVYDGAGNVVADTTSTMARSFGYDAASRITAITRGSWQAALVYGPGGGLARTDVTDAGA